MPISRKNRKAQSSKKERQKSRLQQAANSLMPINERALIQQSATWPLLECLIPKQWEDTYQISQICVARRSTMGYVAAGVYLVDLACLGVKNGYAALFRSEMEYRQKLVLTLRRGQELITADLDLAAKIVAEGIRYADSLGFKPHPDIRQANWVLGEAHPENCLVQVPVGGPEGKPFFVAGPYDNPTKILRILDRRVGKGNYNYLVGIGGNPFDDDLDDFIDADDFDS